MALFEVRQQFLTRLVQIVCVIYNDHNTALLLRGSQLIPYDHPLVRHRHSSERFG